MTDYNEPEWLPELITMESFGGNWIAFFDAVYNYFHQDFVVNKPVFRGKRLGLKRHPEYRFIHDKILMEIVINSIKILS